MILYRFCGYTPPPTITSGGNMMTVIFRTDPSVAREGFTASYVALDSDVGKYSMAIF